jgi:HD domain
MLDMLAFADTANPVACGPLTRSSAIKLLRNAGAPPRFMTYAHLVDQTAATMSDTLARLRVLHDAEFVRVGAFLHDVGMLSFPEEIGNTGKDHEKAGETMLLLLGVDKATARCCISHSRWADIPCCLEELLIALASQLWNGARCSQLEFLVITSTAKRARRNPLEIFSEMTEAFDGLARKGLENLMQVTASSQHSSPTGMPGTSPEQPWPRPLWWL